MNDRIDLVPLDRATLCLDCDRISVSSAQCIGCGSTALLNLAAVLDRKRPALRMMKARTA